MPDRALQPLSLWAKVSLWLLLVALVGFGVQVYARGVLLERRQTDFGCYQRAAWAVRVGADIYHTPDDNSWHYNYPPFFAILMTPLADAPPGANRAGLLPYPLTVALWYAVSLALGLWGAHLLATALEETVADETVRTQPRFCYRWWMLRVLPILILLPAIGRTQVRGQINLVMAFVFCGAAAAVLRRRRFQAGLWLAAAISIKATPAFLLLWLLWRRDFRMLAGVAVGLVLGLAVIPAAAMGPRPALQAYNVLLHETLLPGVRGDQQGSRGVELTSITSTDSNAPMVVLHNIMYPYRHRGDRPKVAAPAVRLAHWAIGAALTLATLAAAGWRRPTRPVADVFFFGALIILMWVVSPVFHPHYMAMAVPLVMALLMVSWQRCGYFRAPRWLHAVFWLLFAGQILSVIDGQLWFLRDFGLVLVCALALWLAMIVFLRRECAA